MRILYAACGLVYRSGSGPSEHVLALARELGAQSGVELTVLFAGARDPIPRGPYTAEHLEETGLKLRGNLATDALALGLHPLRYFSHRKKVLAYAARKAADFDVLVERMWIFGGHLARSFRAAGRRVILEENGPVSRHHVLDPLRRVGLFLAQRRLRRAYRNGRKIIVQTPALATRLTREFHVARERMAVVPNGVNLERFAGLSPRKRKDGPLVMVFSGTLDEDHDLEPLIRAAFEHADRLELRILGSGPSSALLEKLRRQPGGECLRLLGRVPPEEVDRHLAEADLAVAPYTARIHEPHGFQYSPLKLMEYAAAGCAVVVAGPCPSSPAFRKGVNGFLIKNEASHFSRLFKSLPNRAELHRMGAEGRSLVKGEGWEKAAHRYMELICEQPVLAPLPFANKENRYIERLHHHLRKTGLKIVDPGNLSLKWILDHAGCVDVIHLHWPESHYQFPGAVHSLLKWCHFMVRLEIARRLGYGLVWTAHNVEPHEERFRTLDRMARRYLCAHAGTILLGEGTVPELKHRLGVTPRRFTVIPHGHYLGCYGMPGGGKSVGLPEDKTVFLFAGTLRRYKGVVQLVREFTSWNQDRAVLVVAGRVRDHDVEDAILPLMERSGCYYWPGFIPDEQMGTLLAACDFVVLPYREVHMSGSLLLALSHARPVIAPDVGLIREYLPPDTGILYKQGSLLSALNSALDCDARAMGKKGFEFATSLDWEAIARAHACFYARRTPFSRAFCNSSPSACR